MDFCNFVPDGVVDARASFDALAHLGVGRLVENCPRSVLELGSVQLERFCERFRHFRQNLLEIPLLALLLLLDDLGRSLLGATILSGLSDALAHLDGGRLAALGVSPGRQHEPWHRVVGVALVGFHGNSLGMVISEPLVRGVVGLLNQRSEALGDALGIIDLGLLDWLVIVLARHRSRGSWSGLGLERLEPELVK